MERFTHDHKPNNQKHKMKTETHKPYQPKTGQRCHCKPGVQRDNCPDCEGTGWRIDFAGIRAFKTGKAITSTEPKTVPRRTSPRTGDAVWMKLQCGAGSRWTSTTEDWHGVKCNFSGCDCGTQVVKAGETDDRYENWFGLHAGSLTPNQGHP